MMPPDLDFDIDMQAASDEIGESFGGGAEESQDSSSVAGREQPSSPAAAANVPAASPADAWASPPKSWRKELHQHYAGMSPELRQYIHEREQQALNGIMQYKSQYDPYAAINQKYQRAFEHYGVQPQDIYERMIASHLALVSGTPEQRRNYALSLIKDYGLDEVLGLSQDPRMVQHEMLQPIAQRLGRIEQTFEQQAQDESRRMVEGFLADPANEFASEVVEDMVRLIQNGVATDLKGAYDQAIWLNPSVRAKLLEREITNSAKPRTRPPTNVRSSPVPPTPTAKKATGSIEDEMAELYDQINSR